MAAASRLDAESESGLEAEASRLVAASGSESEAEAVVAALAAPVEETGSATAEAAPESPAVWQPCSQDVS